MENQVINRVFKVIFHSAAVKSQKEVTAYMSSNKHLLSFDKKTK